MRGRRRTVHAGMVHAMQGQAAQNWRAACCGTGWAAAAGRSSEPVVQVVGVGVAAHAELLLVAIEVQGLAGDGVLGQHALVAAADDALQMRRHIAPISALPCAASRAGRACCRAGHSAGRACTAGVEVGFDLSARRPLSPPRMQEQVQGRIICQIWLGDGLRRPMGFKHGHHTFMPGAGGPSSWASKLR